MKILMVIDMQNDFINGSLGTKEAEGIVEKVKEKIEECKANDDLIVYTMDTHGEDYLETPEGKGLPVPHCIKGTDGWKITDYFGVDYHRDYIIEKSTFGVNTLCDLLGDAYTDYVDRRTVGMSEDEIQYPDIDSVEFVGLCTDICVLSNVIIAKNSLSVPIVVDASCCAGVTPEKHQAALEVMKSCQVQVINEN